MIIADTLRQEMMPEMVFSICKLAVNKPKKEEMQRQTTLDTDGDSAAQFTRVFQFATKCGFISEAGDGTVSTSFSKTDLSSFRRFRYSVLRSVFASQDTAFTIAAKWYISQDIPQTVHKGQSVFSLNTAAEYVTAMPKSLNVDENFVNGFRFWMAALGLVSFTALGTAVASRPMLFATHRALGDWIEYSEPFKTEALVSARAFFERLVFDLPVFSNCIEGNIVSSSLSSGLRVLESCGQIEIKRITDAGDVWHLSKSNFYSKSNDFTDIIIKEVRHVG